MPALAEDIRRRARMALVLRSPVEVERARKPARVRTPAGMNRYKQPIGTLIVANVLDNLRSWLRGGQRGPDPLADVQSQGDADVLARELGLPAGSSVDSVKAAAVRKVAGDVPARKAAKAAEPDRASDRGRRIVGAERATLAKDMVKRYTSGESIQDIATSTGRSYGFVHRVLTESGLQLRQRGAQRQRRGATPAKATPAARVSEVSERIQALPETTDADGYYAALQDVPAADLPALARDLGATFPVGLRSTDARRRHLAEQLRPGSRVSAPATPAKKATPRATQAAAPRARFDPEQTQRRLSTMQSREEAREALSGLTKAQLLQIAEAGGYRGGLRSSDSRDALAEQIVGMEVGGRLSFAAIREGSGATPAKAAPPAKAATPAKKATPRARFSASETARRLREEARTESDAIRILAADQDLSAANLRRVATEMGIEVPPDMRAKTSLQLHIAQSVARERGLPSTASLVAAGIAPGSSAPVTDLSDYRRALDNGLSPRDAASYAAWVRDNPGGSIAQWQAQRQRPAGTPTVESLRALSSREEAREAIANLNKTQLVALARELSVPRVTSLSMAELRAEIVQATVGRRIDSIAIRGFEGDRP